MLAVSHSNTDFYQLNFKLDSNNQLYIVLTQICSILLAFLNLHCKFLAPLMTFAILLVRFLQTVGHHWL